MNYKMHSWIMPVVPYIYQTPLKQLTSATTLCYQIINAHAEINNHKSTNLNELLNPLTATKCQSDHHDEYRA